MFIFIKNQNSKVLAKIEALDFRDIIKDQMDRVNDLLELFADHCPNLTSFSCASIAPNSTLTLPALPKLTSFSCGDIGSPLTLPVLPNLTSFSCGGIWKNAALTLPVLPNLTSFSCGGIWKNAALTLPALPSFDLFLL